MCIITHEFPKFRGNRPGEGEIIILSREYFIHLHEAPTKEVLLSEYVDGWKMANFLLIVEFEEVLGLDVPVSPHDVPLLRLLGVLNRPA